MDPVDLAFEMFLFAKSDSANRTSTIHGIDMALGVIRMSHATTADQSVAIACLEDLLKTATTMHEIRESEGA